MHRIGVISDTHGLLRPEVKARLQGCEAILHAGDINRQSILDELGEIAPVYAVRGNNDKEWAEHLPQTLSLTLHGVRIFMVHRKKDVPKEAREAHLIIYGHSHKYEEKQIGPQLWLNPGSCGPGRFSLPVTMALLEIEEDKAFHVTGIWLGQQAGEKALPVNMRSVVEAVMKDTQRGRTVAAMAKRHGISKELAEQICRLYLTHPGVDADGILKKMGL